MDDKERERRMFEKALRKPLNDTMLDVRKGIIDSKKFFAYVDLKLKEKLNG